MTPDAYKSRLRIDQAEYVVTANPDHQILRGRSMLVESDRIARIGRAAELDAVPVDRIIDARGMIVTPGFVNAHYHISAPPQCVWGALRDDVPLSTYFRLAEAMTDEDQYATSLLSMVTLLRHGFTTFMDPGGTVRPTGLLRAAEVAGCRMVMSQCAADGENPLVPARPLTEAREAMETFIQEFDGRLHGRVRAWTSVQWFDESVSAELLVTAKRLAEQHGVGLTYHQSRGPEEVERSLRRTGKRPIEVLESLGALGPNVLLAHVLAVDEGEVDRLAATDTGVVVSPAMATLGRGITRFGRHDEMLDKGVRLAIGHDGVDYGPLDPFRALYLLGALYRDARLNRHHLPLQRLLDIGTMGGARAVLLDREIGSIEIGKKADLVLFEARGAQWRPLFDPVFNLVNGAHGGAHTVLVDGRVVIQDGRPTFVDEHELITEVEARGVRLLERTGSPRAARWTLE